MCNGEIVPRAPRVETLIELFHRVTSGLAFLLSVALVVWAMRVYPSGHRVRRGAVATATLMAMEAVIGAGLVLFQLVAHDASASRALSMSLHLTNTFLLLASTALTAWWASGRPGVDLRGQRAILACLGLPLAAMFAVGASGAVTALGDTLFPASTLAAGLAQDLAGTSHFLLRLRVLHPVLAAVTAGSIVIATGLTRALRPTPAVAALSRTTSALAMLQVGAGLLDVLTRAPIAMQLVHLLFADLVWLSLVLTAAAALESGASEDQPFIEADVPRARLLQRQ